MKRFSQAPILSGSVKAALALSSALVLGSTSIAVAEPTNIAASSNSTPLADGTYLYGETTKANQIGQGYVVFRKQGQTVTGAFYYPQSEFSCFTGTVKNQRLEVLSLGMPHENVIEVEVPLTTMHRIPSVGSSEHNSLGMCQKEVAAYQQRQQLAAPMTQWATP